MKRILLLFLALYSLCHADRIDKGREVLLVAEVRELDGKCIPQRGVRVYQTKDGHIYGVVIQNGFEQFDFEDQRLKPDLVQAVRGLPGEHADWKTMFTNAQHRVKAKGGPTFAILDGWDMELKISLDGKSYDLIGDNLGAYILDMAPYDSEMKKLGDVLNAVSLALGRHLMAL